MNNSLKFLNLEQLGVLVTNIKSLISATKTATTISNITFTPADGNIAITQGTVANATTISNVTLPAVSSEDNNHLGLLSNKQYKTITEGIAGVTTTANSAVQWVGTVSGGTTSIYTPLTTVKVGNTTYNNVAAIQLVDDFASASADQKLRAPSTNAVIDAIGAESTILRGLIGDKLDTATFTAFKNDDYNTFKSTVGSTKDTGLFGKKADKATTLDGYGIKDAYTKTETDNLLNLKLDSNTFTGFKTDTYDKFVKATNDALAARALVSETYTIAQVDAAIAAAKKSILTGDATGPINAAYDTILEIANWIGSDATGATQLSAQVATNTGDITTLKTTVYGEKGNAGLVKDVAQHTTDINTLKSGKADKVTTLAGYGITDAYTDLETEAAIDAKVNPVAARVTTLETTTIPNLDAAKANKKDALGSFTDFQLNDNKDKIQAVFLKADGTTSGGTLTIGVITESEINALFA